MLFLNTKGRFSCVNKKHLLRYINVVVKNANTRWGKSDIFFNRCKLWNCAKYQTAQENRPSDVQNLLKRKKCSLNFITDEKKYFKEAVRLGFPGDTTEEKMKSTIFTLEDGLMQTESPQIPIPKVVAQSYQVFECTWIDTLDNAEKDKPGELDGYPEPYHDFNGITSKFGAHFILRVDKILMKERQYNGIINGVKAADFPKIPIDYGYRDSKNFWFVRSKRAMSELLPVREASLSSVKYAADRADTEIKFTDEACAMLVKVPRIFLTTALRGCVSWAKDNGVTLITAEHMKIINDKRSKEKLK